MGRKLLFSVKIGDCKVQTFRAGGPGGQNQNKRDTGVRIIHPPSGAVGVSREKRTQPENKKLAFRRMAQSKKFQTWAKIKGLQLRPVDEIVDEQMDEANLKVEFKQDGRWVESSTASL
jgi:protein subunit release factor B